jgi:transposase
LLIEDEKNDEPIHYNSGFDYYQYFLHKFAAHYHDSLIILQVDNGLFHKAKRLQIQKFVILFFQPPYSAELNPIETVWEYLKQD